MMLKILISVLAVSSVLFAGPFGLHKGMSLRDIDKHPKKLSENAYEVKVPKPNKDFDMYTAIVDPKKGLVKIRAIGKTIKANSFGDQLRDKFETYESKLINLYGKNTKYDFVKSGSMWDDSQYFMIGLEAEERYLSAYWNEEEGSTLKDDITSVTLDTIALNLSEGYITLTYEFKGFEEYVNLQKNKIDDSL